MQEYSWSAAAAQALLREGRALSVVLRGFSSGNEEMMVTAHPAAMLVLTVVKLLCDNPALAWDNADTTWHLSACLLEAAGKVRLLGRFGTQNLHFIPSRRTDLSSPWVLRVHPC